MELLKKNEVKPLYPQSGSACKQLLTVEQRREAERIAFITDIGVSVLSWLGSKCSDIAINMATRIKSSSHSEKRDKNSMLVDYTKQKDVLAACNAIIKAEARHSAYLYEVVRMLRMASRWHEVKQDAGEDFMNRLDVFDERFGKYLEAIRKEVFAVMKPYKCTDPMTLYTLVYAVFVITRFRVVADYIMNLDEGFCRGGQFHRLTKLDVVEPLLNLIHRCQFQDKQGRPLKLLVTKGDMEEFEREKQKKSWQIRNAQNPPVEVRLYEVLQSRSLLKANYILGHWLFHIPTFDAIVKEASGGIEDPEYRKDYNVECIQSCHSSFEQAMLFEAVYNRNHRELPNALREYYDHLKAIEPDGRKRKKPVVMFSLVKANPKIDSMDASNVYCCFTGVWDNAAVAAREVGGSEKEIYDNIRQHKGNDGKNRLWMLLTDFIVLQYDAMKSQGYDDVADNIRKALPEIDFRRHKRLKEKLESKSDGNQS